jgi:hypothetical protein
MKFSKLINYVLAATIGLQFPLLLVQSVSASPAPTVAAPIMPPTTQKIKPPQAKPGKTKPPQAKPKKPALLSRNNKYGFSCSGTTTLFLVKKGSQSVKKVPLIEWTEAGAEQFGENYTAESRCKTVSSRFKKSSLTRELAVAECSFTS